FGGGVRGVEEALGRGGKVAGPVDDLLGEMGSRAFAVHVLALLGKPEPGYASKLLEQKAKLPRFGTAYLARALAATLGPRHAAVTGLMDDLARAVKVDGQLAMVPEPPRHRPDYYM